MPQNVLFLEVFLAQRQCKVPYKGYICWLVGYFLFQLSCDQLRRGRKSDMTWTQHTQRLEAFKCELAVAKLWPCCTLLRLTRAVTMSPLSLSIFSLIKLNVEAAVTLMSRGTQRIVVFDSPLLADVQFGALRASWQIVAYEYVATRVPSEHLVINSVVCACVCSCWWMWMFSRSAVLQGFTSYASLWLALFFDGIWKVDSVFPLSSKFNDGSVMK